MEQVGARHVPCPSGGFSNHRQMTNKEYLTKSLNGLNVSEDDMDIILLKAGIDGNADANVPACDKAVCNRMSVVLKGTLQNVSEGGYSVSWNMEAVKLFYNALCNELGLENVLVGRPKIRNRSDSW
jgi:hypothetical protein